MLQGSKVSLAMGISRDSRHKHYKTGGRSKTSIKKRKYATWRQNWERHNLYFNIYIYYVFVMTIIPLSNKRSAN